MNNQLPYQVGITGGIGSGKSLACRVFRILGIPIYEADARAKWLMNHNPELKAQLSEAFGESAYQEDGSLNRRYLAEQVFGDSDQVAKLNSLVHPKVREDGLAWAKDHADAPYILREIPLLFETGAEKTLDATITVSAPEELRIERVKTRDPQRSEKEVRGILSKQASEEERLSKADHVLYNDEKQLLLPQIIGLHEKLVWCWATY